MKLEQSMRRKKKYRDLAISNLGIDDNESMELDREKMSYDELKQEFEEQLEKLSSISKIRLNGQIVTSNDFVGKVKRFIKRVIRKILNKTLKWYYNPILEQQNEVNANLVSTIASLRTLTSRQEEEIAYLKKMHNITCDYKELEKGLQIDYFKFEDCFRGTRETVIRIQKQFLKYFVNRQGNVIDIGCGRGEFLELLREHSVDAIGIEPYPPFVEYCRNLGLHVEQQDAIMYLKDVQNGTLAGMFMSHVVEHLNTDYILRLIQLAYEKLQEGAYFILQTPNPEALFTLLDFYIDIEHKKPIHFRTLEFYFRQAGFSEVMRYNPEETKFKNVVSYIEEGNSAYEEFNAGMGYLNQYLSGYQDYVLIARR